MLELPPYGRGFAQSSGNRVERKNPLEGLGAGLAALQGKAKDGGIPQPLGQASELAQLSEDGKRLSITAKLQGGIELTDEELEYLRRTDPDLYQKATQIKTEREQYRRDLKRCKTREEVEALFARKQQIFLSDIKSVKQCVGISKEKTKELMEQIGARMAGIWKEHTAFKESAAYQVLPGEKGLKKTEAAMQKHPQAYGKPHHKSLDLKA